MTPPPASAGGHRRPRPGLPPWRPRAPNEHRACLFREKTRALWTPCQHARPNPAPSAPPGTQSPKEHDV